MYGPVATWCSPYVDGFSASYCFAYSSGTGALTGRVRAPITPIEVVSVELDLERRVVRSGDPADVGSAAGRVVLRLLDRLVDPLDAGQVGLNVAVRDARQKRALDRVLDVGCGSGPVDRRRVLDVVVDRVGDRLAVLAHGRHLGRQAAVSTPRCRRARTQSATTALPLVTMKVGLVVGGTRVDVVDVAGRRSRSGRRRTGRRTAPRSEPRTAPWQRPSSSSCCRRCRMPLRRRQRRGGASRV